MLSTEARKRLVVAHTDANVGKEIADAIDAAAAAAAAATPRPAAAHVASVTAPDATDLASAETLANANKVAINALISSLQTGGYLASS